MSDNPATTPGDTDAGGAAAAPTPTPGPRPGAPSPAALARKIAARPATSPEPRVVRASDPSEWGRVDDTGAVFVRTPDGERQVGSWQAGAPEEGLAHFGLRFDDLVAEVALLEARLDSHPQDARKTRASAESLAEQIPTAAAVGDLDSLAARAAAVAATSGGIHSVDVPASNLRSTPAAPAAPNSADFQRGDRGGRGGWGGREGGGGGDRG
ncbi:MAG TPA: hypothetical protein PKC36_14795, partial [Dietzia sp.]|nr:hypothetical protein [Dietzia sp.]